MKIDNEYEKFLSEIGEGPAPAQPSQDEYAAFMAEINNPGEQPPWAQKQENEPLPPWATQNAAPATLPPWQQQPGQQQQQQQQAYAPPYGGWPNPQQPY